MNSEDMLRFAGICVILAMASMVMSGWILGYMHGRYVKSIESK